MTLDRRMEISKGIFDELLALSVAKAGDYASDADTLQNFKEGAFESGLTQFQYWKTLVVKHQLSIKKAIQDNPNFPQTKTEPLKQRILDVIVYHLILLCMLEEVSGQSILEKDQKVSETLDK